MISMEKQFKFLNEIVYKRNQSIQTLHMLAPKGSTFNGRPTFANTMYHKKAQSEKPCLFEIPYDTSDPANRFVPNREETLTLEKESRSKLNTDLVRPYVYTKQNSLYENFKPASQEYHEQLAHANKITSSDGDIGPMAQLLEAPTAGYEDAIVVPEITADNFELKHGLLNLVQNKQFFGHDKEDPHAHIRYFNKITSTMKFSEPSRIWLKALLLDKKNQSPAPTPVKAVVGSCDIAGIASAVILNKLPKKLGDPGRFLIPCEFSGINTCNALADLGASINLMPYSVWKNLSLPELTPTCNDVVLADRINLLKQSYR
ncbi:reverse transcriptase domain-containing protein [Tanacetum coccineum]